MIHRWAWLTIMCVVATAAWGSNRVRIDGGSFRMGSLDGNRDEQPVREIIVGSFLLDRSPVTVAQFGNFVRATGHETTAERLGNSVVFHMNSGRWSLVRGADFRRPRGPDGPLANLDHPVTHVSWFDAKAYCEYVDARLPTETEFEYAAKSGTPDGNPVYAFGDMLARDGDFLVNIYTGFFPFRNTGDDGYVYTAPVGETGITPLGLTDMAGNVWEWSADWYLPYVSDPGVFEPTEKSQRGGSFLCDKDYCRGYRTTARSHSTPDTSAIHVGFRCATDPS